MTLAMKHTIELLRTAHEALQSAKEHVPEDMWALNRASAEIDHLIRQLEVEVWYDNLRW